VTDALDPIAADVVVCRACPRLVEWRERAAREKVARFAEEDYWGRPVPGFGDARARILVLGLAPAAHGGNRTGRIFTGDRSGDFLFAALHRAGLANRPASIRPGDGLRLRGAYVSAVNRCAPPGNAPTPQERDRCLPFLEREIAALPQLRVVVALGAFAWDGALRALARAGQRVSPKPKFGHGARASVGPYVLLGCFHPSQQNTFTGRLTPAMFDEVLAGAVEAARAP
jgi:uracil-DNA glycosylase family 4